MHCGANLVETPLAGWPLGPQIHRLRYIVNSNMVRAEIYSPPPSPPLIAYKCHYVCIRPTLHPSPIHLDHVALLSISIFSPRRSCNMSQASQILLIGSGGVGTIAALNIESGGGGHVTAVLRSNYDVVHQKGFQIESCDHGVLKGWRPARSEYSAWFF